jgi:hypothetical protein
MFIRYDEGLTNYKENKFLTANNMGNFATTILPYLHLHGTDCVLLVF